MEANLIPTVQNAATTQPPLLMVAAPRPNVLSNYQQRHSKVVGVMLMIGGALSIIFHAISIHITTTPNSTCNYYFDGYGLRIIGHGIWSGTLCVVAGCMGVAASRGRTRCKIAGFMVMTILSAPACFFQLLFAVFSAHLAFRDHTWTCRREASSYPYCSDAEKLIICRTLNSVIALDALVATMSIIDGFAAIWGSAICCRVLCCGGASAIPMYGMTVFTQQQGGQVTFQPCPVDTTATASGGFIYQSPQLFNTSTSAGPGAAPEYGALSTAPPSYDYAQSEAEKMPLAD